MTRPTLSRVLHLVLVCSVALSLLPSQLPGGQVAKAAAAEVGPAPGDDLSAMSAPPARSRSPLLINRDPHAAQPNIPHLYRTTVVLRHAKDRARLDSLGLAVLHESAGQAVVVADDEQLETLARLRFEPRDTTELSTLVARHADDSPLLADSLLQPLRLASAEGAAPVDPSAARAEARLWLKAAIRALPSVQQMALAAFPSLDSDGDGLTDTEEAWWCTDPNSPDSDGDGVRDGAEVAALKDWMANRRAGPPASGPPFRGWPMDPADPAYNPNCIDRDRDAVPDAAETWVLGLNPNRESTDRDKFDDGQELFGITKWGWGSLPRIEEAGIITAEMPSWVKAPGNHPLVAAFPVPEIDIVPSSLHVQTVTNVTTDHTISSGTERLYSTAKTEGTSDSVANTETWNDWQEVSVTTPGTALSTGLQLLATTSAANSAEGFSLKGLFDSFARVNVDVKPQLNTAISGCAGLVSACASIGKLEANFGGILSDLKVQVGSLLGGINNNFNNSLNNILSHSFNNNCLSFNCGSVQQNITQVIQGGDRPAGGSGTQFASDTGQVIAQRFYQVSYPAPPVPTTTSTRGSSRGGALTTTHTEYEEQTITNGEAFSNGEAWGNATAVDSARAAEMWFSYKVRNKGTEYAREIGNIAFNIIVGADPNPIFTYFVAPDIGGAGKFINFMPNEEHTYTSRRIPLTLEQMKAIDLGGPLRIVVEDFSYGVDELFYQDAANAGVLVAIEDGTDDGDELVDTYLIPTWGDRDTVQDVIARYFPYTTDADGNMVAIWTPEYRSDTPPWCNEPRRVGTTLWCKRAISTADWWNIYLNNLGDGTSALKDTPARPNATVFFRFNKDSDLDGYSDRSERRLGSDPLSPASFPKPELVGGVYSVRSGTVVTATLSLLNTGLYDAYGVEAVMVAPDDSVSITNNTVGGSGRVRAQRSVVVGSRIKVQEPLPSAWAQAGHARPAAGGYYTGDRDRTYTFTVQCSIPGGCDVGSGTWSMAWTDDAGGGDPIDFGSGYASPSLRDVARGVKIGLLSGRVFNGDRFTVQALTPRDTFQYTINREPYIEPVVIVSYNDPQGNHRFITPVRLNWPDEDLARYRGQMLADPGVEIVTTTPFTVGVNTVNLTLNNPSDKTLANAHLFLEFISITGTVASEVPVTVTVPPGPSVVSVAWSTSAFSPTFQAGEDYIVMAFLTDYQGNILDTAGRPLSSFQADPKPAFAVADADLTWDFGSAQQGTLLQRQFRLASVGFRDLLTHLRSTSGISVTGPSSLALAPGDMAVYTVTINTELLSTGPFSATSDIRTSDPNVPTRTISIRGTITPGPAEAPAGALIRPLDWTLVITGSHPQGESYPFTHTLDPDPQTLHPVKVYSTDYSALLGVGKYATPFGQGTASSDMFGTGQDGDWTPANGENLNPIHASASGNAGSTTLAISNVAGTFQAGQKVLIHQTRGSNSGVWELNDIASVTAGQLTLKKGLSNTYTTDSADFAPNRAQVLWVPQYHNLTIPSGVTVTPMGWTEYYPLNGAQNAGGILAVLANGTVMVNGIISANGMDLRMTSGTGFNGSQSAASSPGFPGEGTAGPGQVTGHQQTAANGNGGGGAGNFESSGGGGGNGTPGNNGGGANGGVGGAGGAVSGSADLTKMTFGGGGGAGIGGGTPTYPWSGNGGGIVFVSGATVTVAGTVTANGFDATNGSNGRGGGGAGGSILLKAQTASLGTNLITAKGGAGGIGTTSIGGNGGEGLIRIETCDTPPSATSTNPPASTQKLDCYITEQVEAAPYDRARLNLPEAVSGERRYQVQFGRRYTFTAAGGAYAQSIRMPKQLYASASLDALVSGISSGSLSLQVDIGNDGSVEMSRTMAGPSATVPITGFVAALNAYLVAQTGVAWGADVDVPVRVQVDRQAEVILTNLVLSLQFNQPSAQATAVEVGADRPLDWPLSISGSRNQGQVHEFTHTLGPDSASLHPCTVYDQSGRTLKGVGRYCADFGQGTGSLATFGTSNEDLLVPAGSTITIDDVRATLASDIPAGTRTLPLASNPGFAAGQEALLVQMQGPGAGLHEYAVIETVTGNSLTLKEPLRYGYNSSPPSVILYQQPTYGGASETFTDEDSCLTDNGIGNDNTQSIRVSPGTLAVLFDGCDFTENAEGFAGNDPDLNDNIGIRGRWTSSLRLFGSRVAQVIPVRHYRNVTVQGTLTVNSWKTSTGGVGALRASGTLNVQAGGRIDVSGKGFRGGPHRRSGSSGGVGYQGEGTSGPPAISTGQNATGGGSGSWFRYPADGAQHAAGGGGGGNGAAGQNGQDNRDDIGGQGGVATPSFPDAANPALFSLSPGGGGGAGGVWSEAWSTTGGPGGGTIAIAARTISVSGSIASNGGNGQTQTHGDNGGGGGAGGTILLLSEQASLGSGLVSATGGAGGPGLGGNGAQGRIRVEYCRSRSGSSNPAFSEAPLSCYIADQAPSDPSTAVLTLPESFTNGQTYLVQFGRRYTFAAAGADTKSLRLRRQMYGAASMDALISGVTSGSLTLQIDVGADGSVGWRRVASSFPTSYTVSGFVDTLNAYLLSRNDVPWGNPVNVPVRVQVDRQAEVMLTNLALTPVGATTRFLRLPARQYSDVRITLQFGTATLPSAPLAFTVDAGADGSIDWSDAGSRSFPAALTSPNLAAAFNAYLAGRTGEVDVPIRIVLSPSMAVSLNAFTAVPLVLPDIAVAAGNIAFGAPSATEGDVVSVTATLTNTGGADSGPFTASFFASLPGVGSTYIGSAFVPNVPANGTAPASILWDTLGFVGTMPVRVEVDPFRRLAEASRANNGASAILTLRSRPDVRVGAIILSNDQPVVGELVTVTLVLSNTGQTTALAQTVALFAGNPDASGTVVASRSVAPIAGLTETATTVVWTPTAPGPARVFAQADRDAQVSESNEGNNLTWRDVYVGFRGPLVLDSGGPSDRVYTPTVGYGYVDEGQPDRVGSCGGDPQRTFRIDPDGRVVYRFDHVLSGDQTRFRRPHFYHLDVTLFECDGAGRQETIKVNGVPVAGPIDLTDGQVRRLSILLDPALHASGTVSVTVGTPVIGGAIIGDIALHDVDYRYADAGGAVDPRYPGARAYGWLEGDVTSGILPFESVRANLTDNQLRYRFDALQAHKFYNVHLSFYQASGATRVQNIQIDGVDTGLTVTIQSGTLYTATLRVPPSAYATDGSIVVGIVRTNASAGAMVSEIALEEDTLALAELPPNRLAFLAAPIRAAHGYDFGVQPSIVLRDTTGVTLTADSTTVVTLAIKSGSGASGAVLTCDQTVGGVTTLRVTAGVATFSGCFIDRPGAGYVLEALSQSAQPSETALFNVTWAGDTDGDGRVSIIDYSLLITCFGAAPGDPRWGDSALRCWRADVNGDQVVDVVDHSIVVTRFGTSTTVGVPPSGP